VSKPTTKLKCESLELRENPSSYLDSAGNLIIVGTEAADSVTVFYEAGSSSGLYSMPPRFKVTENGVTTSHTAWWMTGRIYFYGYGGNDYFNNYANATAVTAYGHGGDDTLIGYGQADYLDGGTGNDTLQGYAGNDTLIGGDGNDSLYGMDGNDWIEGQNGSDYISGGAGNDTLIGCWYGWGGEVGGANDTILGGAGNDALYGGDGDDWMEGQDGSDYLKGDNGNDTLIGCWYGWGGEAGGANDVLLGGAGNDGLYGGDGNDDLYGEAGNDYLKGDAGADLMDGGDGFDRYQDDFNLSSPFFGRQAEDIIQQGAPTCQTLAVLAAAADVGHNFANQLTNLGNNTWRVRVFPNGVATDINVTFDGSWSDTDPSPTRDASGRVTSEFWTILFQRARLATFGITNNNEITGAQWSALNAANGNRPQNASDAMRTLTGRVGRHTAIGSVTFDQLSASLLRRDIMTAYGNGHVWAIRDVYVDSPTNTRMIRLYNPYGYDQYMTYDAFRANFQGVEIG
jgi:Ca2+-binding RTX toxin-like protein